MYLAPPGFLFPACFNVFITEESASFEKTDIDGERVLKVWGIQRRCPSWGSPPDWKKCWSSLGLLPCAVTGAQCKKHNAHYFSSLTMGRRDFFLEETGKVREFPPTEERTEGKMVVLVPLC